MSFINLEHALPRDVRRKPAFLLWRKEQDRKIPYYANGRRRSGANGSPGDRRHLVTFDQVVETYKRGGFDGIGLALLPDLNIIALDFDHCRQADGTWTPVVMEFINASYAEVSPSGKGVRVLLRGSMSNLKSQTVEVFSSKGYVTLTGQRLNGAEVAHLTPDLQERIEALSQKKSLHVDFSPSSISEGARNNTLASLAGTMRRQGMSGDAIEAALLAENEGRCDPPLPEAEVRRIAKSIARYEPSVGGGGVKVISMDSLRPEATVWVWEEYLARTVFNLVVGEGGLGKSQLALAISAIVSTGGVFPDGTRTERGNVVILSAEDHPTKILLPRLLAAGADTSRIHLVQGTVDPRSKQTRLFSFEHDLAALKAKIEEIGDVTLVIVDPITAYMGLKVDSHQTSHVRSWLLPISAFAESLDCAVLIVAHFNKSSDGRSAVDRISGSAAWSQAARRVLFVVRDGERRLFLRGKTNLSRFDYGGFEFSIVPATVGEGIPTTRVQWGAPTDERADDLVRTERAGAIDAAEKWLRERLARGPVSSRVIAEERTSQSFSFGTVKRAAKKLGVLSRKTREGWIWRLP